MKSIIFFDKNITQYILWRPAAKTEFFFEKVMLHPTPFGRTEHLNVALYLRTEHKRYDKMQQLLFGSKKHRLFTQKRCFSVFLISFLVSLS